MPEIIINTEITVIQAAMALSQLFLSAVRAVSFTTELDAVIINTSFTYTIPLKNEDLIMTDRALEELIFDQSYNPFPLVRYSERPDVVSTHIHHGYLAIICDTSSSVMMLPTPRISRRLF